MLRADGFETFALDATPTEKRIFDVTWGAEDMDKGGFAHFMRKEIHEQSSAVERALKGRLDERFQTSHLGGVTLTPREVLGIREEPTWGTMPPRSWDTSVWIADPRAITAALGWRATTSFADGFRCTVDWVRRHDRGDTSARADINHLA